MFAQLILLNFCAVKHVLLAIYVEVANSFKFTKRRQQYYANPSLQRCHVKAPVQSYFALNTMKNLSFYVYRMYIEGIKHSYSIKSN